MVNSDQKLAIYSLKTFFIIAVSLQLFRFITLYFQLQNSDLYVDEVYYWGWAQSFELGYYSKPPVLAWLIMLTTSIFGESEWAIKIGAILIYPVTSVIIYLISDTLFKDKRVAFYTALAFLTIPAVSLSSMIISTDVVLLLFWSLSLYFFIKALQKNQLHHWVLVGLFAGLGMLSKYNMVFFLVSALMVMGFHKAYRGYFKDKNFYIALILSFMVFSLNLYWQYQNDFISFVHTKEISNIESELFHIDKFLEFIGAQFAIMGPIFFAFLLFLLFQWKKLFQNNATKILYLFVIPYFLFISTLSLLSHAYGNWSAPIYIAGTILVVSYMVQNHHLKLLKLSIAINILLALIFYFFQPIVSSLNLNIPSKIDPYKRVMGWEKVANEVAKVQQKEGSTLLFNSRTTMAEMIYYLKPHPFDALTYNPSKKVHHQYDMHNRLTQMHQGKTLLFITEDNNISYLKNNFENIKHLKEVNIPLYKDFNRSYHLYRLEGFKGYQ